MAEKEEKTEKKEAAKSLEEECAHMRTIGVYCLVHKENCFYDNQKECPKYEPRVKR